MEPPKKSTLNATIRKLHRNIGFFIVGMVIIYSISGVLLIYRDTDLLKHEVQNEKELAPNLDEESLGKELRFRNFEIQKKEGDLHYFRNGTYNSVTGKVEYTTKKLPEWLNKFNSLHKVASKKATHWLSLVFGVALLFMAISSFWMFKPNSKPFKRGLMYVGAGIVLAVILLFL